MSALRQRIDEAIQERLQQAVAEGAHRRYVGHQTEALKAQLQSLFCSHVILTNSGTSAVELALRAAGVRAGDEIILSGYDYPGNFWVVEQLGCVPVLIDTTADSTQVDLNQLDSARSERTRACIVSHLHGQLQHIVHLREWTDKNQLFLIEDACQAMGAKIDGTSIGTFGHFGILSFSGSKVVSAGRGGALLSSDERLFQRAKIASGTGSGAFGLSEIAAAIVTAQLPFLDEINQSCSTFFDSFQQSLAHCAKNAGWLEMKYLAGNQRARRADSSAFYQAGWVAHSNNQRALLTERLTDAEVSAGAGFVGFHRRSRRRCRAVGDLIHTAALVERLLVIHHSVAIDQRYSAQQLAAKVVGSMSSNSDRAD